MSNLTVVRKSVAMEPRDVRLVKNLAKQKGLGSMGFSAALRMIIREWEEGKNGKTQKEQNPQPEKAEA